MPDKEKTLAAVGRHYVEDTSMGGIRRAARPGVVVKVIWSFLIVAGAAIAVISVIRLYSIRSRSNTQRRLRMTSRLDDARALDFPAVTVCNVNPVVFSAIASSSRTVNAALLDGETSARWLEFLRSFQEANSRTMSAEDRQQLRLTYQSLVDQLTLEQRAGIGHDLSSMLEDCRFGDMSCDTRNFTVYYHHKYGNCYTFLADRSLQPVLTTGVEDGLTLNLVTNSQDYAIEDEAGFVVAVHDPQDTVFLPEDGVFVSEGHAAHVVVTTNTEMRPTSDECRNDDGDNTTNIYSSASNQEWRYSQRACQHGCLQRELFSRCGCCDLDIPCPASFLNMSSPSPLPEGPLSEGPLSEGPLSEGPPSAGVTAASRCLQPRDVDMYDNFDMSGLESDPDPHSTLEQCRQTVMENYVDGNLSCLADCQPRCSVTRYSTRLSLTARQNPRVDLVCFGDGGSGFEEIPVEETLARSKRGLAVSCPQEQSTCAERGCVRIHVYFEHARTRATETVLDVDEDKDYDWSEQMADFGGIISLWLGLSVLGMLEIVHMLVEFSFLAFSKCCTPGPEVTPVKPV